MLLTIRSEEAQDMLKVGRRTNRRYRRNIRHVGGGYDRSGYRLLQTPDLLLPNEIKNGLATKIFGREIKYYKELVSTNNEAKQWAANGAKREQSLSVRPKMAAADDCHAAGFPRHSKGYGFP